MTSEETEAGGELMSEQIRAYFSVQYSHFSAPSGVRQKSFRASRVENIVQTHTWPGKAVLETTKAMTEKKRPWPFLSSFPSPPP
jgi:hypothetical protein